MIDALMWALTMVGLPALFVAPALLAKTRRRDALFLLLTMLAAGLVAVEIQFITLRPRPNDHPLQVGVYFPSFPSGHAAIAFAWATFVALLGRHAIPALVFASLIAISRVYLGHHHPSDVVMGGVLGAATAAVSYGAFHRGATDRPHWAWWLWPQLAVVLFAGAGAYLGLTNFEFLHLPYMDKALHFFLFGLLAFFVTAWTPAHRLLAIGALCVIAIADEALQAWSPVRTFDVVDLACTLIGILSGTFACCNLVSFLQSAGRDEERQAGRGRESDSQRLPDRGAGSVGGRAGGAADLLRSPP